MSNQSATTVFFRDTHRAYLDTHKIEILDDDVMYLNLYRQKTHAKLIRYHDRWSTTIRQLLMGLIIGVPCIPIWFFLSITVLRNLTNDDLSKWGQVYTYSAIILLIPLTIGVWISGMLFRRVMIEMVWGPPRLRSLLQTLVKEGKLIQGHIQSAKINRQLTMEVTYRFTTPTGKDLKRVFYPVRYTTTYAPGTPVWVLYLNDDISVLL